MGTMEKKPAELALSVDRQAGMTRFTARKQELECILFVGETVDKSET